MSDSLNPTLTPFDHEGQAHMVDVGDKSETRPVAVATGRILMEAATFAMIRSGNAKKGDVLGIARIAATLPKRSWIALALLLRRPQPPFCWQTKRRRTSSISAFLWLSEFGCDQ